MAATKLETLQQDREKIITRADELLDNHAEWGDSERDEFASLMGADGKCPPGCALFKVDEAIALEEARQARLAKDAAVREKREAEEEAQRQAQELQDKRAARTAGSARLTTPDKPTRDRDPSTRTVKDQTGRVTGFWEDSDETVTLQFSSQANGARQRQSYREAKRANYQWLKSNGYAPWNEFKSFAEFVRAGFEGHQSLAFANKANKHMAVLGMNEGLGSDGGFTVMPEFASGIIDRVYSNDLWGRTDNYTVTGNNLTFLANAETSRATGSRHGGLRGYWLGEGSTITASKPTLREVSLKLVKLGVIVYLTQELIDDGGFALSEYVTRKASEEFNFMIGDSLVNGTGAGQPLGMLNFPSLVSVAKENGQLAATLETENIIKMFSRFYAGNRGNMVWLHNQDIEPELFTMVLAVGAGGVVTYMPPGGLSSSPYASLMGRPMLPTEFNATLGTQGDILGADMSQILSISKGGVAQAVSMHVQFLTDQLALRFIMRLNAGPWESAPITPYKGTANTQSSFVTLDARA